PVTMDELPQLRITDHGGGPGANGKFERDLELLKAEVVKNPGDTRSWFYLAQTYRDLDMHEEAVNCYLHRAEMGGYDEAVYWAYYQAGYIACAHIAFRIGAPRLLKAWEYRPSRAESLRALSGCANAVARKIPYPAGDHLFVEPAAYETGPPKAAPVAATVVQSLDRPDPLPFLDAGKRRK